MNKHFFKEIKIKNVRGIDEATLKDLSGVNLLLGGNNGGKTSVLEAISLLNCKEPYDFVSVSSYRTGSDEFNGISNIRYMFKTHKEQLSVFGERYDEKTSEIKAEYSLYHSKFDGHVLAGRMDEKAFLDYMTLHDIRPLGTERSKKEIEAISLELTIDGKKKGADYFGDAIFLSLIRKKRDSKKEKASSNIIYVSPSEHFSSLESLVSEISMSSDYKTLTIELMKLIDPSLEDFIITKDPVYGTYGVYLKTKGEDPVPISLFGDGSKKALVLACYIAKARGGVLLIDEIETSLHHSLYGDLFRFLVKASKHFGVQLFITTHSQEVIDCFLEATEEEPKMLKCYTIRKYERGVAVRDLDHSEAQHYGELGIEVRD